ncbi:hypothetical protein EDD85DRAFT_817488 [Armillaria nabsnona]|nr:hypothetical protein EDD85DRAFT_817488 [Armillaria nabsnona]
MASELCDMKFLIVVASPVVAPLLTPVRAILPLVPIRRSCAPFLTKQARIDAPIKISQQRISSGTNAGRAINSESLTC